MTTKITYKNIVKIAEKIKLYVEKNQIDDIILIG